MITVTAFRWVPPFAQGSRATFGCAGRSRRRGLRYRLRQIGFEDQATSEHGAAAVRAGAGARGRRADAVRVRGDPAAHRRQVRGADAARRRRPGAGDGLGFRGAQHRRARGGAARRARPVPRRRGVGGGAPAGGRGVGAAALADLAARLAGREWLEDRFTAGDLMMATVLLILRHTELVAEQPAVAAYLARCTARPAYARALGDHSGSVRAGRGVAKQPSRPSGSRQQKAGRAAAARPSPKLLRSPGSGWRRGWRPARDASRARIMRV